MINFLITTSKFIYLHNKIIQSGKGYYFGACKNNDFIYVLARNNNKYTSLEVFDNAGQFVKSIKLDGITDVHDCHLYNQEIYITNTGHNCISIFNIVTEELRHIQPLDKDINHYNAVYVTDNNVLLMQFRSKEEQEDSALMVYDRNFQAIKQVEVAAKPHTIKEYANSFICCESLNNGIVYIDKNNFTVQKRIKLDAPSSLIRGIGVTDNDLYYGVSRKDSRATRGEGDAEVKSINGNSFTLEGCGQIYSILEIN